MKYNKFSEYEYFTHLNKNYKSLESITQLFNIIVSDITIPNLEYLFTEHLSLLGPTICL